MFPMNNHEQPHMNRKQKPPGEQLFDLFSLDADMSHCEDDGDDEEACQVVPGSVACGVTGGEVLLRRGQPPASLELGDHRPTLVVQSPKTPTLNRKLKAISLDSEPTRARPVRDVFSMPNTPKKITTRSNRELFEANDGVSYTHGGATKLSLSTNLKRFASNTSISGSQTLKTLPEIMMLHDFSSSSSAVSGSEVREPVRMKARGLLERRGSNASLTIDLGSALPPAATTSESLDLQVVHPQATAAAASVQPPRLNSAKSISTLNLTSFGTCFTSYYQNIYKCEHCVKKMSSTSSTSTSTSTEKERIAKKDTCGNCTIYESVPKFYRKEKTCHSTPKKKCNCVCNLMGGRKSLSNENLYVPPCSLCVSGGNAHNGGHVRHCRGYRRACYPRQADLEAHSLSDDFKMHLQNVQYLQTAGSVLSIADLRACCELPRVPKLHQEFWEVPLNLQEKCIVSGSQTRNRYKGVLPNEHSRVHLDTLPHYIHANYIKGPDYTEAAYVATQGPMAHTCDDFWQMVWQVKCDCIVMLTQLVEKGRNKCELYFPLGKSTAPADVTTTPPQMEPLGSSVQETGTPMTPPRIHNVSNTLSRTTSSSSNSSTSSSGASSLSTYSSSASSSSTSGTHDSPTGGGNGGGGERVSYYTIRTAPSTQPDKFTFGYATPTPPAHRRYHPVCKDAQPSEEEVRYEELDDVQYGSFRIHFVSLQMLGDVSVRILRLVNLTTKESRLVRHYWYANWQDHKMAEPAQVLRLAVNILDFLDRQTHTQPLGGTSARIASRKAQHKEREAPCEDAADDEDQTHATHLVVHCSAGIGRTGCFLAILNGIQQLRTNANVDVLAILCSLRLHRGGMVQTAEQYELIHRVLGMYAEQIHLKT